MARLLSFSCALRTRFERRIAGTPSPAPRVHFFCPAKRNERKKRPPRVAPFSCASRLCREARPRHIPVPGARRGILPRPCGLFGKGLRCSGAPCGVERQSQRYTYTDAVVFDFPTPYATPEHRKALGMRPEGVAHTKWATGPRDRMSRQASAGPKAAERKKSAASGGVLSLVAFFARAKKATHGSGAEHPRLKHRARRAHEIFFGYRGN